MSRRNLPRKPKEIQMTDPKGRPIIKLFGGTYVWVPDTDGNLKLEHTGNPWVFKTWPCCGFRELI